MFGVESADGTDLLYFVSPGGALPIDRRVTRTVVTGVNDEGAPISHMETTTETFLTPYAMVAEMFVNLAPEVLAESRLVRVVNDPMPDPEGFTSTEKAPEKIDGVWHLGWQSTLRDLTPIKVQYAAQVDAQAEYARLQYITAGAGQAMVYQQKLAEARDKLAGGSGPWPMLTASVGLEGSNEAEVATLVTQTFDLWIGIAAAIEGLRLNAKHDIAAASTLADIRNAGKVTWPTP